MIFLKLFWTFFKIGLFTFGGGYGMIPIIQQEMAATEWVGAEMMSNFIGISETTPGPIAINMATFVGSEVGRAAGSAFLGSFLATLGVVLPSFIIILLIALIFKNFLDNRFVKMILSGIRPVVLGLIFATGILLVYSNIDRTGKVDYVSLVLMAIIAIMAFVYKRITKKDLSPIIMILASAGLGMAAYSVFPLS